MTLELWIMQIVDGSSVNNGLQSIYLARNRILLWKVRNNSKKKSQESLMMFSQMVGWMPWNRPLLLARSSLRISMSRLLQMTLIMWLALGWYSCFLIWLISMFYHWGFFIYLFLFLFFTLKLFVFIFPHPIFPSFLKKIIFYLFIFLFLFFSDWAAKVSIIST